MNYEIKRLLVSLDTTEMDETLLKYTAMLTTVMNIEKVYFLHVADDLVLDEEIREKYPDLIAPVDETIRKQIQTKTDRVFKEVDVDVAIHVLEGDPFDTMIRWSEIKEVDLMIMGRKISMKGSGFLPSKMAQVLLCSLLLVPENCIAKIEKVLVPFDFSDFSDQALLQALEIRESTGAEVICQHIYEVPVGYSRAGKSFGEFAAIMRENAEKKFEKHMIQLEVAPDSCTEVYELSEKEDLTEIVYRYADTHGVDMIMVGSRGRRRMAGLLLNSVAAKLVKKDHNLPIMIVKNKEANMSLFEALLNI